MADAKVSALSAAGTLSGTEVVHGVQAGGDVKITTQAIADLGGGGGGSVIDPMRLDLQAAVIPTFNSIGTIGSSAAATVSGTASNAGGVGAPRYRSYTTAATANSNADAYMAPVLVSNPSDAGMPGLLFSAHLVFPDASYSSARMGVGVSQNSQMSWFRSSDNGAFPGMAFQYSTTRGSSNWFFVNRYSSSAFDAYDTGVAFSSGTWAFRIWWESGGGEVFWSIRKLNSTDGASGSFTTNIVDFNGSGSEQTFNAGVAFRTIDAVARTFGVVGIHTYTLGEAL